MLHVSPMYPNDKDFKNLFRSSKMHNVAAFLCDILKFLMDLNAPSVCYLKVNLCKPTCTEASICMSLFNF